MLEPRQFLDLASLEGEDEGLTDVRRELLARPRDAQADRVERSRRGGDAFAALAGDLYFLRDSDLTVMSLLLAVVTSCLRGLDHGVEWINTRPQELGLRAPELRGLGLNLRAALQRDGDRPVESQTSCGGVRRCGLSPGIRAR